MGDKRFLYVAASCATERHRLLAFLSEFGKGMTLLHLINGLLTIFSNEPHFQDRVFEAEVVPNQPPSRLSRLRVAIPIGADDDSHLPVVSAGNLWSGLQVGESSASQPPTSDKEHFKNHPKHDREIDPTVGGHLGRGIGHPWGALGLLCQKEDTAGSDNKRQKRLGQNEHETIRSGALKSTQRTTRHLG
ncbi:hypothetical protein PSPO01_16223 [Paraphaeosphaeria sporulosa]